MQELPAIACTSYMLPNRLHRPAHRAISFPQDHALVRDLPPEPADLQRIERKSGEVRGEPIVEVPERRIPALVQAAVQMLIRREHEQQIDIGVRAHSAASSGAEEHEADEIGERRPHRIDGHGGGRCSVRFGSNGHDTRVAWMIQPG